MSSDYSVSVEIAAPPERVWSVMVDGERSGGTRATLSISHAGLLGGLASRLTRALTDRYPALEAAGLKARSEGRA